ncbi:MAG: tetratricopeptide repeat protein [Myxococcaceae bacterium]|nr:tetratricopeptide repeat protein [Myxococcaceae bacterium]
MTRLLFALVWCLAVPSLAQKKSPAPAPLADVFTEPAMTKEALLQFIPRELEGIFKQLDPAKARVLKDDLEALERSLPDPKARLTYGTLLAGLLDGLGYNEVARVYNGWAVLQHPDSTSAIINVGALNCFPPIIRLGIELDPKSPIPHVNLASCAMSLQRWDVAKTEYEKALALDPNHRPALLGMGQWWLHVPDLGQAIPYFVKANGLMGQKFVSEVTDEKGKPVPPTRPVEPDGNNRFGGGPDGAGGDEGGAARVTKNRLELPPLPKWGSPDAFILSGKSRQPLARFYGEKMGGGLKFAAQMLKDNPLSRMNAERKRLKGLSKDEQDAAMVEASFKVKWEDSAPGRGIALNYAWADRKLDDANKDFEKATEEYKKIGDQLTQIAETRNKQLEAMCPANMGFQQLNECIKGAEKSVIASCKQSMVLNAKFFVTYRDAYRRWYDAVKPVLEELFRVQGLWIRQIGDKEVWQTNVLMLETYVFTPLAMKMVEEDVMRLALAAVGMSAFGRSAEVCPKEPPAEREDDAAAEPPEVPRPDQKCPLPKDGVKIPPFDLPGLKIPFSFIVKCTEAEFRLSTGISKGANGGASAVLSVKHRFGTDKSTTVYVGVEAGLKKEGPLATEVGVKGELGVSITFDRNAQLTDVGGRAGVSESISLPEGAARASAGVTATIEKGAPSVTFKPSAGTKIPGL